MCLQPAIFIAISLVYLFSGSSLLGPKTFLLGHTEHNYRADHQFDRSGCHHDTNVYRVWHKNCHFDIVCCRISVICVIHVVTICRIVNACVGDTIVKSGRPSDLRGPIIALSGASGLLGSIIWRERRVFVTYLLLDR